MKNATERIKSQAEKCVYCAICSTVCPTYQLSQIETESPRGRVVAMGHVADNALPINARFGEQIQHCLQCGRCEQVCPAEIKVTELVSLQKRTLRANWRAIWARATWLLWGFQLARRWRVLGLMAAVFTPKNHARPAAINPAPIAKTTHASKIGLFVGCTGKNFDRATYQSTIHLLNALDVGFTIPDAQTCCGILDFHEGDTASFDKLQEQNLQAIAQSNIKKYLYFTSGCGTGLKTITNAVHIEAVEITAFLAAQNLSSLSFRPLPQTVFVHIPCTHTSQNSDPIATESIGQILRHIPEISLQIIPSACCGSAGLHALKFPKRADALRKKIIQQINQPKPIIVSTNVGCALHLARGFGAKNATITHPITLLQQQLL